MFNLALPHLISLACAVVKQVDRFVPNFISYTPIVRPDFGVEYEWCSEGQTAKERIAQMEPASARARWIPVEKTTTGAMAYPAFIMRAMINEITTTVDINWFSVR